MIAALAAVVFAFLQGPAPATQAPASVEGPPSVQMGLAVVPETVTVGQPFRVSVRVRAPRGAAIDFPAGPDSVAEVEAIDPRQVRATDDPVAEDQTALYRLAAWDVGDQPLHMGEVVVRLGGAERRIPLGTAKVYVASVLPADSAQRVPKPARDIFGVKPPWWWPWLPILLALALLTLLLWLWWRRRRRPPAEQEVNAIEVAEREFARVEAMRLLDAGERGRHVALMVDVLRDFLARRVPGAAASLTSSELLGAVRAQRSVPAPRLAPLLAEADLIKFARRPVSRERAQALGAEAREIVREVERVRAEEVAAAAAAAEAAAAAAAAKAPAEPPREAAA